MTPTDLIKRARELSGDVTKLGMSEMTPYPVLRALADALEAALKREEELTQEVYRLDRLLAKRGES